MREHFTNVVHGHAALKHSLYRVQAEDDAMRLAVREIHWANVLVPAERQSPLDCFPVQTRAQGEV